MSIKNKASLVTLVGEKVYHVKGNSKPRKQQRLRSKSMVHSGKHKSSWDGQKVVDQGVTNLEHEQGPGVDPSTENALEFKDRK